MTSYNILDLDVSASVNDLDPCINVKYIGASIQQIIQLIKNHGKYNTTIITNISEMSQYYLPIKYLGHLLPVYFEFDVIGQYIYALIYNSDQTKTFLKLHVSIIDEPTIKYVENDRSGFIPQISSGEITLKPGEYLVNFSHCFFYYLGFNRSRLDDDSLFINKKFGGEEIRTKLWLYMLLTKYKSWYAKFGYEASNSSPPEYEFAVKSVCSIKLQDISILLKNTLANHRTHLNSNFVEVSNKLVEIIGDSTETLAEYTKNHSLEEFSLLTNNLSQSIYSKKINIYDDEDEDEDGDEDDVKLSQTKENITFDWYDKLHQLFVANVCQINNNIGNYFCKKMI